MRVREVSVSVAYLFLLELRSPWRPRWNRIIWTNIPFPWFLLLGCNRQTKVRKKRREKTKDNGGYSSVSSRGGIHSRGNGCGCWVLVSTVNSCSTRQGAVTRGPQSFSGSFLPDGYELHHMWFPFPCLLIDAAVWQAFYYTAVAFTKGFLTISRVSISSTIFTFGDKRWNKKARDVSYGHLLEPKERSGVS